MKLTVKNVARVALAEIDLCGITVLAGANQSGKSTISRSLMTISSISRRINSLLLVERGRSIINILRDYFKREGGDIFYTDYLFKENVGGCLNCLNPEWWSASENVVAWLKEHNRQEVAIFPSSFLDGKCIDAVKSATPKILEVLSRSDQEYIVYICRKLFKKAFDGQIKPVFLESADSAISIENDCDEQIAVEFKDGEVSSYIEMGRTFYPSVVYFEPINYVDFVNNIDDPVSDRYSGGRLCSCSVIRKAPSKNLSLEEQAELDEAKEIIKDIIANIHGRLVDDDTDIKFNENFSSGNYLINVKNIASGMKTMAAIVRAVENRSICKGSLLIIDEPESNLHPKWQVSFAIFLTALAQRMGVSLLLNTHSPYFMQAVKVYSRENKVACKFYDMINDGDISRTKDVTESLDCVFRSMAEPFNDLIGM